jgi:dienelactone hydrolase
MKSHRSLTVLSIAIALTSTSLFAAESPVVPLWINGAPGSEARRAEPEKKYGGWVSNIHNPSLLVFLPTKDKATGAAVIVLPGGGQTRLSVNEHGTEVAQWLADHGVAAFVLKSRLAKDEANPPDRAQPYTLDTSVGDLYRATRLVRSRAQEWAVNPAAVGVLGLSAGGEVALLAVTRQEHWAGDSSSPDLVEQQSARPDFFALMYPNGLPGENLELIQGKTPPAFLVCAYNDKSSNPALLADFFIKLKKIGINAELHIYSIGGHGFAVRPRPFAANDWSSRFMEWLRDRGFLSKSSP